MKGFLIGGGAVVAVLLLQGQLYKFLDKLKIGFKSVSDFDFHWDNVALNLTMTVKNESKTRVVLESMEGRIPYDFNGKKEVVFAYNLGQLILEPDQTVAAKFKVEFPSEAPFALLNERLKNGGVTKVKGWVKAGFSENTVKKVPFFTSI